MLGDSAFDLSSIDPGTRDTAAPLRQLLEPHFRPNPSFPLASGDRSPDSPEQLSQAGEPGLAPPTPDATGPGGSQAAPEPDSPDDTMPVEPPSSAPIWTGDFVLETDGDMERFCFAGFDTVQGGASVRTHVTDLSLLGCLRSVRGHMRIEMAPGLEKM